MARTEFILELEEKAPHTYELFRSKYLRKNFPYWEDDKSKEPIIYFCEMDFRLQIGFFIEFLSPFISRIHSHIWHTGDIDMFKIATIAYFQEVESLRP